MSRSRPLVAALTLALLAACSAPPPQPAAYAPCEGQGLLNVGDALPDCRFEGLAGHADISLTAIRGTPLILNFWAGWCPSCIKEMPAFDAVARDLGAQATMVGFDLLGVMGETKAAALSLAERTGVTYRLAYDRGGYLYAHFSGRRTSPVLPATVLVDADGTITDLRFGELNGEELRERVRSHLGIGT